MNRESNNHPLDFCEQLSTMYTSGMAKALDGGTLNATGLSTINNLLTIRAVIKNEKPKNKVNY